MKSLNGLPQFAPKYAVLSLFSSRVKRKREKRE